jgi:hypothetical protein
MVVSFHLLTANAATGLVGTFVFVPHNVTPVLVHQYSSGSRMVVAERSASVMIQTFVPPLR